MRNPRAKKVWAAGLLILALAFGHIRGLSEGQTFSTGLKAGYEVFKNIAISETTPFRFGRVQRPTSSQTRFTIGTDGSLSKVGGDGEFVDGQQKGTLSLDGSDGEQFALTFGPASCTACSGFTLSEVCFLIDVSPATGTLDTTVSVGGTVQVDSTAEGTGTCSYHVTSNYQ